MKKRSLIDTFRDLRHEYPNTTFITVSGPCGSGKTRFSKLLAQKSQGFSISLDAVAVGEFITNNLATVEKIANKKFVPGKDDLGTWFTANILDREQKFYDYMNSANKFIESRLCDLVHKLKTNPTISYGQEITNKNFAATDTLFGTPQSTNDRLFIEMSPLPKNIVDAANYAVSIWAERSEREKRWITREGATTPEAIKLTKCVFNVASNVEERLLQDFRSDFFFDNTQCDPQLMQEKVNEITSQIFSTKESS